ncbi:glyoxalase [Bacillus pseudomycoides]|uniref:VOC family protein n=1 Tax=Bacillus pseudomycoides TaxID=64104 RepID=UPI000BF7E495|nr:glyoxalase [Bacillus pseudomycoides]PFZ11456.1 glyoxalase [Bacillus pseudomycoides]
MSKVLRFEIQVPNPEEAIEFYTNSFGWKFEKMPGPQEYWFIITGESDRPGIDGGQVVVPKTAIPNMGYFAYCLDNQGLLFGVSEANTEA